jgi:hypothetical protein
VEVNELWAGVQQNPEEAEKMKRSLLAVLVMTGMAAVLTACGNGSEGQCIRTGCSGQVCAEEDVVTTCEWRDEYACYRFARCERQPGGGCGWTATEEQARCLANLSRSPTRTPPTPTPTPGRSPVPNNQVAFPGCESITAESHYCLTLSGRQIGLLGLDSGETCGVATTDAPVGKFLVSGSIAWQNEDVYVCGEEGLLRISVRDGSWESGCAPCSGVVSYRGGLLVNRRLADLIDRADGDAYSHSLPLAWFPTYQYVQTGQPERAFSLGGFSATMTVQGEKLYTAWHAGKSVEVSDLGKGEVIGVLTLENYNGWMLGMPVTEDGYLVLSGDPWGRTVYVFDAYDGKQVKRFDERLPGGSGLACVINASITPRNTPTPTATPPAANGHGYPVRRGL